MINFFVMKVNRQCRPRNHQPPSGFGNTVTRAHHHPSDFGVKIPPHSQCQKVCFFPILDKKFPNFTKEKCNVFFSFFGSPSVFNIIQIQNILLHIYKFTEEKNITTLSSFSPFYHSTLRQVYLLESI